MIELNKLRQLLDDFLPANGVADYCPNGLQIEGKSHVTKIATGVSADLNTIKKAVELGVDALIVHHGLFWQKDNYVIEGIKKEKIRLLIENNISLFGYHLPLDMHPQIGNNWKAAKDLGWFDLEPFGFLNGIPIGVKGKIKAKSRDEVQVELEKYYGHKAMTALGGSQQIESLALISGGAHKSIVEAIGVGVDGYITGSFDEPIWHQAFERVGPIALATWLHQELNLPCTFIDTNNPF
jgi:dinuclear metal center YbgI/SA1388 family protein